MLEKGAEVAERVADEILFAALERLPEERAEFIARACGDDPELRREIESLIAAHSEAGDFLEDGVALPVDLVGQTGELVGRHLGPYEVFDRIGTGGMGEVYRGERADDEFRRQVAIKVVKAGLENWHGEDLSARFRRERQVLADLDHPNIARLLDGGTTEHGRPYLVMEMVAGEPIDSYCDRHQLDIQGRLRLFRGVCSAVSHAHQNLIVHRDLKPGNILVTEEGVPKLLDFGIAKLLEPDRREIGLDRTAAGRRLLSPRYASPEQVRGEAVTTASDVYSLGVVLYQLLTGELPYPVTAETTPRQLEEMICEHQPVRPSTAPVRAAEEGAPADRVHSGTFRVSDDLDWILLMALRKEAERRYQSVDQLSDDIGRSLRHEPVMAGPDSASYRLRKFVHRHTVAVVAASLLVVALVLGAVVTTSLYLRADRAQQVAHAERETTASINLFLEEMLASVDPSIAQGRDVTMLREILDRAADRVETDLGDRPHVAAALQATIGAAYSSIGEYSEAEAQLRSALEIRRRFADENAAEVADVLYALGKCIEDQGRYAEAEPLVREALDISAKDGSNPVAVMRATRRLATLAQALGDHESAEQGFREAMRIGRESLAADHQAVRQSLTDLGVFLMNPRQPRLEEAESVLREALSILRRRKESDPLQMAGALQNLAGALRRSEDYDGAEELYREAIDIKRRILPPDHPNLAIVLNGYATLLESKGDYAAAEPLYREALSIQRAALGEDHRDLGTRMNNLAGMLRKAGRPREAVPLYRDAVDVYRRSLGSDHAWVGIAIGGLATTLAEVGDFQAAVRAADDCLRVRRLHWSEDHWRIAICQSVRGDALARLGRLEEGERLLLASARSLERSLGLEHRSAIDAWNRLEALYQENGNDDAASEIRARLEMASAAGPPSK